MKILNIVLTRYMIHDLYDENRINGHLTITYKTKNNEIRLKKLQTIENVNYLMHVGIFPIKMEYSPKFKRQLWELKDTQPRTEIKFHTGFESKHSKGCILLSPKDLQTLHYTLQSDQTYYLTIQNI